MNKVIYLTILLLVPVLSGCPSSGTSSQAGKTSEPDSSAVVSVDSATNAGTDSLTSVATTSELKVCSFNIKFVGLYTKKDHAGLADILKGYDVVVIQELVSPPVDGEFPDGTTYTADVESKAFVDAMTGNGFQYQLSPEDTGTGENNHNNGSATEWFIVFYKSDKVRVATDLPNEFLAEDRSNHPSYERVPYAFSFRTPDNGLDFTLISVHLQPGNGTKDRARRVEELDAIEQWIAAHNQAEKDILVVGDMNIYTTEEVTANLPVGYRSLNEAGNPTTVTGEGKPYDQVMYNEAFTGPELVKDFTVIDLTEVMRPYWTSTTEPYPVDDSNLFFQYYSDHNPVVFTMVSDGSDDD